MLEAQTQVKGNQKEPEALSWGRGERGVLCHVTPHSLRPSPLGEARPGRALSSQAAPGKSGEEAADRPAMGQGPFWPGRRVLASEPPAQKPALYTLQLLASAGPPYRPAPLS